MCLQQIPEDDEGVIYQGKMLHDECLVCTACYLPLAFATVFITNSKPYCKRDNPAAPEVIRDPCYKLEIAVQPEKYQIANYNVYPAPSVAFSVPIPKAVRLIASLIENYTQTEVPNGFTSGNMHEICAGTQTKTFSGMKLCKKVS
jgi:hypothetical protein